MMPALVDKDPLRVYAFHGVDCSPRPGSDQAIGDCPFCGREGKFYIGMVDKGGSHFAGGWDCKVCGEKGNELIFLSKLWTSSTVPQQEAEELRADRRYLDVATISRWGLRWSRSGSCWLVPGWTVTGKLCQLYKYVYVHDRKAWLPTPGLGHGLFRMPPVSQQVSDKPVWLCEGVWDLLALWETMIQSKRSESSKSPVLTSNEKVSLAEKFELVGVPSCSVFNKAWPQLFAGRQVTLAYHSDHPREHPPGSGKVTTAGYDGLIRAGKVLLSAEQPPKDLRWLCWGEKGFDPERKSGYDIRDALTADPRPAERVKALSRLLGKVKSLESEGKTHSSTGSGAVQGLDCAPCERWLDLKEVWVEALHWTPGLDAALAVSLACVTSTKALGDQLWLKVIGPPSSGKSTIAEALSVNKDYTFAKSTMRGIHSGWKSDRQGKEDHGLVPKIKDKTFIIKDGDTLLQAPNLSQILSELRDLYDSTARVHYRHGVSRDHEGIRTTIILYGTQSLRVIDRSELGERFLDCIIMDSIDDKLEDEILKRVVARAARNMALESDTKLETTNDPKLVRAMQLTGGYINWLRANANTKLATVSGSMVDDPALLAKLSALGKFVSYMRARPSGREHPDREFSPRLVSQLTRLAACLAVVLNKDAVDNEVTALVKKVANDTARGVSFDIVKALAMKYKAGLSLEALVLVSGHEESTCKRHIWLLKKIGALEQFADEKTVSKAVRIRLTGKMTKLYEEAEGDSTFKRKGEAAQGRGPMV